MKVAKDMIIADVVKDHVVIHFITTHIRELADVERVVNEIQQVIDEYEFRVLVLNFSRLKMLTSSFLGKLVMLHKHLKRQKVELRACSMAEAVYQGFKICKLQKLIPVFSNEAEAVA